MNDEREVTVKVLNGRIILHDDDADLIYDSFLVTFDAPVKLRYVMENLMPTKEIPKKHNFPPFSICLYDELDKDANEEKK